MHVVPYMPMMGLLAGVAVLAAQHGPGHCFLQVIACVMPLLVSSHLHTLPRPVMMTRPAV